MPNAGSGGGGFSKVSKGKKNAKKNSAASKTLFGSAAKWAKGPSKAPSINIGDIAPTGIPVAQTTAIVQGLINNSKASAKTPTSSYAPFVNANTAKAVKAANQLPFALTGKGTNMPDVVGKGNGSSSGGTADDPLWDALLKAAGGSGSGSGGVSGSFKGNLQDYIKKAAAAIPGVSYAKEVKAVKGNAAQATKDIGSMYSALAAYTAGQAPVVKQQYANSATDLKTAGQDAADLGNSLYSSLQSNMAQGAGSTDAGSAASAAVGQQAAVDQNSSHKDALAASLAQGLQSALINNTSQGNAQQGWITNSGNAAQLGGRQNQADVTKALQNQLAQYATLQSQADAQKAAQALQFGESQYNADRSYAEQAAAAAQSGQSELFNRLATLYGLQQNRQSAADRSTAAEAKAATAQKNTDTANAIKVQANETAYINNFVRKFGRNPTKAELAEAGY